MLQSIKKLQGDVEKMRRDIDKNTAQLRVLPPPAHPPAQRPWGMPAPAPPTSFNTAGSLFGPEHQQPHPQAVAQVPEALSGGDGHDDEQQDDAAENVSETSLTSSHSNSSGAAAPPSRPGQRSRPILSPVQRTTHALLYKSPPPSLHPSAQPSPTQFCTHEARCGRSQRVSQSFVQSRVLTD